MAGGGIGQESVQPLRVDASQFVAPLQLGVQQNAVAAMTDAFRKGQISANDIAERYGVLAKSKEKFQIQGIDEFLNPAAIHTRQNQQAALNTDAILKSSPEYIAAREAEMQATINSAQAGSYPDMLKAVTGLGFFPKNRDVEWTDAKKQEVEQLFAKARAFTDYQNQAKAIIADSKLRDDDIKENERVLNAATGQMEDVETVRPRTDKELYSTSKTTGHKVDEEELRAARRAALLTPSAWEQSGMPSSPFGEVPGKVAPAVTERSTTTVTKNKVIVDADGKRTEETSETKTVPEGVTEAPATPALPVVSRKVTPVVSTEKQPTEAQQRAQTAIQKFAQSGRMEDAIAGYDPTTYSSWIAGLMPNFLRFGAQSRQTFEAARDLWQQGLLRMESGAAISPSEKVWYNTTFFPELNDPPALVESKGNARRGVEDTVAEIANAGGVVSPESVHAAWDLKQQRAGTSATSTQAGRPAMTGERKIIDLPGIGKGYYDATTKKFHPVQ